MWIRGKLTNHSNSELQSLVTAVNIHVSECVPAESFEILR